MPYIDDTLTISKTYSEACQATIRTAVTLSNLGFSIHPDKSVLNPTQEIVFLGFIIDSVKMQVRLTQEKKTELKQLCRDLLAQERPSIRTVATVLGKMVVTFPGVQYGKLHYRELEKEKTSALKQQLVHFDRPMSLTTCAQQEVLWWINSVNHSVRDITRRKYTLYTTYQ